MGASAPFWRFSAASYPDLEENIPVETVVAAAPDRTVKDQTDYAGVCTLIAAFIFYVERLSIYSHVDVADFRHVF